MKTQKLAAIDIGSNSLKLVIVEAAASDSFTVLLQERERVRLGHETLRNKFLSAETALLDNQRAIVSGFKQIFFQFHGFALDRAVFVAQEFER